MNSLVCRGGYGGGAGPLHPPDGFRGGVASPPSRFQNSFSITLQGKKS